MGKLIIMGAVALVTCAGALWGEELRNGRCYPLAEVPSELTALAPAGTPVRFALEENGTTGYSWEIVGDTNECEIVAEHFGAAENGLVGAAGRMSVTVTSKVQTPARVEFRYRRSWEQGVAPVKTVRLILRPVALPKGPSSGNETWFRKILSVLGGWVT